MRFANRPISTALAVVGLVLAAGLGACGDGKKDRSLLTVNRASQLRSSLDDIERMVNDGDCLGASNGVLAFEQKVNALPGRTDTGLRDALASGASRLQRLVESQCKPVGTTGPTLQAPQETDRQGKGKKGKGKAKGHQKKNQDELPDGGTTGPTVPDENLGITTP
jgi:hypothetical protein